MTIQRINSSRVVCLIVAGFVSAAFAPSATGQEQKAQSTKASPGDPPANVKKSNADDDDVVTFKFKTEAEYEFDDKEPTAKFDELLGQALDKNPDVVAAKAKLELAQAELRRTRMDVARQLIVLWSEESILKNAVATARDQLRGSEEAFAARVVSNSVVESAKRAVIDAETKLARIPAEIRYLTGNTAGLSLGAASASGKDSKELPQGAMAEQLRKSLDVTTDVHFEGGSLGELLISLRDKTKISIQVDNASDINTIPIGEHNISLDLPDATLRGILQAIEDKCRGTQFVVREYGLLLTLRDRAEEENFVTIAEFIGAANPGTTHHTRSAPEQIEAGVPPQASRPELKSTPKLPGTAPGKNKGE